MEVECPYCKGKGSITTDLASMSVNNALIELAKENGGVVVTKQVIGWFVKAGVFATRGQANDNIHSTLRGSRHFHKEGRGVYRLKDSGADPSPG